MKQKVHTYYHKTTGSLKARPVASFFIVLGLLLVVLLVGRLLQPKTEEKPKEQAVKQVRVYRIGEGPKATFQAKIEKSGVVKLVAQAPGIVQSIAVTEGQTVGKGQQIVSLSSNYQGGNAASVQRQVAQTQYQNVLDTFDAQKEVISKQRDVATASAENTKDLREITRKSVDDTNSLITTNQQQLDQMNQSLAALISANPASEQIQTLQGSIAQLQSGLVQLRAGQRTSEYQVADDKPPVALANLQKDIALKQLEVQEKGLTLTKEVSRLQVNLAAVSEAMMYPASPFSGTVERVYVHVGQTVSPGTPIATVVSKDIATTAVLTVPEKIATMILAREPSTIIVADKTVALTPYYISTQATDGQLFSVFYDIPEKQQESFSDGEYVSIRVPIGTPQTTATDPLIPIDAVYQTQDNAFVLVVEKNKAATRTVKLGTIIGNYVEVFSGLTSSDQVILDRNVIAGDRVKSN